MKILFNNKGIALVILIIAMTLISLLGAGIVSFMGTKQRSYPFQVNSYRALNLANAGVEYMIKYANDQTSVSNSTFFSSPSYTNTLNFGGGTFTISYNFNQTIGSDVLTAIGTYQGTTRQVRLSQFRNYTFENLTRIPGSVPFIWNNNYVVIPLINNLNRYNQSGIIVSQITISVIGGPARNLEYIYFSDTSPNYKQTLVFDYASGPGPSPAPLPIPPVQLVDIVDYGPVSVNVLRWCTLQFQESGAMLYGVYTITYTTTDGQNSVVTFTIP